MTTEEMIRKALERPLVECPSTMCGPDKYNVPDAVPVGHWLAGDIPTKCEVCNGTGKVREPLAQAVLDALAVVVELGHHYHPYWRDHSLCLGTKLGPGCVLHPGDGKDCHGTGYVPRTVDLNDRVSVAEACGRLLLVCLAASTLPEYAEPGFTTLVGKLRWYINGFDYTAAHDALGRLPEALWGVEVEA